MKRKLFTSLFTLLFSLTMAWAQSPIDGKWTGKIADDYALTLDLKTEGAGLTGTIGNSDGNLPIKNGKVTGNEFAFQTEYQGSTLPVKGRVEGEKLYLSVDYNGSELNGTFTKQGGGTATAQRKMKPEETEVWDPVPKVVTPGKTTADAPSDAIILFDGKNLDQWVSVKDKSPAQWTVKNGVLTVNKAVGNIETKRSFKNYQLHIEWKIPEKITLTGQSRGNSGIFLASTGPGDAGYELQVLDSYENKTYSNGQAGSIYKQAIPLANPNKKPGEWQVYDIIWNAPTFNADGSVQSPARVTVIFNGVVVQNNFELKGETVYIGQPQYKKYDSAPIKLQAHGDPSEPISFRNIWVREL
ncbi:3-keto-disaccharide hydrolase [Larkinella sp. VNQ87]|uniref:3-keto-disaccharide hydrolase n=1 Tax=Larkinella sp. VNQ87 TaxID=3400921 RepID=UPI003C0A1DBA